MYDQFDRRRPALPWLACVVFALGACQETGTSAAIARASGGLDVASHAVPRTQRAGDAALAGGDAHLLLPDDFPDDVYLPARYTIDSVLDVDGTAMVAMTAQGRVPMLFADARKAMRGHGWRQTMAAQHSVDNAVLAFEKDARSATLSFNRTRDDEASPDGIAVSVQLRSPLQGGDSGGGVAHGF
jgi:hypothetical protein